MYLSAKLISYTQMNLFSGKIHASRFALTCLAGGMLALLASCNEYKPFVECTIDGTVVRIETTVAATYVGNVATVAGDGGTTDINVRFNGTTPGNYTCGSTGNATIEVYTNSTTYTTTSLSGSGTVQVITAGNNLIEGYFSGQLYSGTDNIIVTNGSFSGRAF